MHGTNRKQIVILGGGFGGAYAAQALERQAGRLGAEITLLDRRNFFLFTPLMVEAGTGSLEPRHAVVSIRSFLRKTRFLMAEVTGVDAERREVAYLVPGEENERRLRYDHLVISLGSVTLLPPIPGLREFAFEMKTIGDSVALRDRAIQMLEIASATDDPFERKALLHFVVVGASYTGVEAAGEFQAFITEAARAYPNIRREEIRFTLIERGSRMLPHLDEELGLYALDNLRARRVEVRLNTTIREISAETVTLHDGTVLHSRTLVWCAGIAPNPLVGALPFGKNDRGLVATGRDLRVHGHDDVWAIGDCAAIPAQDGRPYPPTAQHAIRQARHLAGNIARVLRGEPTRPCDIVSAGTLTSFGCYRAVAKVFNVRMHGFLAWWIWRSFYLMKMPSWSRRVRIALDWTAQLFFKHDIVQLGVHRTAGRPVEPLPAAERRRSHTSEDAPAMARR